ncbi:hypothetical protein Goshw_009947 [Gossypium schwendimanii]|uniref:Reverse transcriptase n=1 Tax=Gossypium schwendimanii TaxID=34291 RepID=A0A7J9M323_GOSSC|nr:hypothetical protein [Gossypium schwendimanii]
MVLELIDSNECIWKQGLINDTFLQSDAVNILQILLAQEAHEDFLVWGEERSGEFSVCSAYKLLQKNLEDPTAYALQTRSSVFYKLLWNLDLPGKIKITIWKISWNYLPTLANLKFKKLVTTSCCPRCASAEESMGHLFRRCPTTVEVWSELNYLHFLNIQGMEFEEWLTWAIWKDRNRRVHDRKIITGKDTSNFVSKYMEELKGLEENICTKRREDVSWKAPPSSVIKINFDSAFDGRRFRSVSGMVARDARGTVLFTRTSFHERVVSAFAAEALACQLAVSTGFDKGWIRVIIKRDSLTTVKKCKPLKLDKSQIGVFIRNIQQMKSNFQEISFNLVPRPTNELAHALATKMLKGGKSVYLEGKAFSFMDPRTTVGRSREPD